MKNMKMLIWITQLGLNIVLPPLGFIYLAVRLQERFSWGNWVIWAAIALGLVCAIEGLRSSLKAMLQMSASEQKNERPVSFNDHD